jgi:hypothetical protein
VWIFFIFWSSKICVSPTSDVSSLSPPRCHLSSGRCRHTTMPCHAFFPLSQDELAANASSFSDALSCLPSQAKTKALNLHHRRRLPSPDRPTHTLYYYKKIILTLITIFTTQPRLHFASSLARAPCHRRSTCHCHSLSPLSHAHHLFAQRHTDVLANPLLFLK